MTYNDQILKTRRKSLRKKQTDTEIMIWSLLRDKKCKGYKFYRQYSIGSYIVDFYCPKLRLSIEIDGSQHAEKMNKDYDQERTIYLNANNIKELRFWNNEVTENLEGVYQRILENTPS